MQSTVFGGDAAATGPMYKRILCSITATHTQSTRTKHTSASRTPDIAERCRSKAVGDWKSESCIHLRLCAASLELHCTYIFFFVFVCALWDKNCLLCTHWFTTRSCRRCIHSNPSVQVKVMYLKDVSVTSPTGFGRSILTTNLPKLSEPDIQNLCFSFGEWTLLFCYSLIQYLVVRLWAGCTTQQALLVLM